MSQIITKKEIHDAVINALNTLVYKKANMEICKDKKICNYQFFDNKRNYHFDDVLKIQVDYAYDRIYTTLFYDSENNKQCSISNEVIDKGYHEDIVERAKQQFCERDEKHFRVLLNDKEIINFVI